MTYVDKKGREVEKYDLLKIYHFTGAGRKKYYLYMLVVSQGFIGEGLAAIRLDGSGEEKSLSFVFQYPNDVEIIARKGGTI